MSNLFTRFGDAVLQNVAPKAAAEAVCVTTRQKRCVLYPCGGYTHRTQERDCYDGTSCSGCNSWRDTGCGC